MSTSTSPLDTSRYFIAHAGVQKGFLRPEMIVDIYLNGSIVALFNYHHFNSQLRISRSRYHTMLSIIILIA